MTELLYSIHTQAVYMYVTLYYFSVRYLQAERKLNDGMLV